MLLAGPTWYKPGGSNVLKAARRYDGSRSRKTKGSLADTLQCNIWRRAQTPHRMTHCLHGGGNHDRQNVCGARGLRAARARSRGLALRRAGVRSYRFARASSGQCATILAGKPCANHVQTMVYFTMQTVCKPMVFLGYKAHLWHSGSHGMLLWDSILYLL